MIKGITFDSQHVAAKDHGALFAQTLTDGIVKGCALNYSSGTFTIGAGYMVAAGRLIQLTATESIALSGTYARVILNIDTTRASTSDSFAQVYFTTDNASSQTGFPALTKNDVNGSGTLYQMEIAIVRVAAADSTGIVSNCGKCAPVLNGKLILGAGNYGSTLPENPAQGQLFFLTEA